MTEPQDITVPKTGSKRPVIEDPDDLPAVSMQPVGVVHSNFTNHFDTPRQPSTREEVTDAWIILRKGFQNMARDLVGFDRIWVLFEFNYSRGWKHTVIPPRDTVARGLFATRCPHRPNPIGLSCVRMLNAVGHKILIRDHDFLHGTPVLDIKPYLPYCDAWPDAQAGWVDDLADPGPDHRWD